MPAKVFIGNGDSGPFGVVTTGPEGTRRPRRSRLMRQHLQQSRRSQPVSLRQWSGRRHMRPHSARGCRCKGAR
eukprot:374103-Pyramimonas_sp.AAC.1